MTAFFIGLGKIEYKTLLLKFSKIKSPEISKFSLIRFLSIRNVCALCFICFKVVYLFYDLITFNLRETKRKTWDTFFLLQLLLGCSLYFTIAFINGSFMFWLTGSPSIYCGIPRLVMMFEKKTLRTVALFLSFSTLLPCSTMSDLFIRNNFIW